MKLAIYLRLILCYFVLYLGLCCFLSASLQNGVADLVLGQKNFNFNNINFVDNQGLNHPYGIAVDHVRDRVYVADTENNRVLWWNNIKSLTSGAFADGVLGQKDFYSRRENGDGQVDADVLKEPVGLALDAQGNLWVADRGNNRVLRFDAPIISGMPANIVLGQSNFKSNGYNAGVGVSSNTMAYPSGVSVSSTGALWVADRYNNRVLCFFPPFQNGMSASIVIGQVDFTHNLSNRGGWSAQANTLYHPNDVFISEQGMLYVADTYNHRVLIYGYPQVNSMDASIVLGQSNFANKGGNRNGITEANTLYYPYNIYVSSLNNIFVSDCANNRVLFYSQPISSGMNASSVIGQDVFTSSLSNRGSMVSVNTLSFPGAVVLDKQNNLWVVDRNNNRILKYYFTLQNGLNASVVLGQPNFFSNGSNLIDGKGLSSPIKAVVDKNGRVYVSDQDNHRILWWDNFYKLTNGRSADGVLGQENFFVNYPNRGSNVGPNTLYAPYDLCVDSCSNLWVADRQNNRVLRFDSPIVSGMNASLVIGQVNFSTNSANRSGSIASNTLYEPESVAVDNLGNLWIADTENNRVLKYVPPFTNGMDAALVIGQDNFVSGNSNRSDLPRGNTLSYPTSVACGSDDTIWVVDHDNNRVLCFSKPTVNGTYANIVLGQMDFSSNQSNQDGNVEANTLSDPQSIAIDRQGNIWVSDSGNNRILKYTYPIKSGNSADSVIGQVSFSTDCANRSGLPSFDTLYYPWGIFFDDNDNLWVADYSNNRILCYNSLSRVVQLNNSTTTLVSINYKANLVQLDIQPGTFNESVTITLSTVSIFAADVKNKAVSNINFSITLSNSSLQPLKPIRITVFYNEEGLSGLDENKLVVCRFDEISNNWITLPSRVYPDENKIVAETYHLSKFAIVQLIAAPTLDNLKIFPVPYNPKKHLSGMVFDNISSDTEVKIYTISGELVKELREENADGRIVWDGKNNSGKEVSSGVYFGYLKSASGDKKVKIIIER